MHHPNNAFDLQAEIVDFHHQLQPGADRERRFGLEITGTHAEVSELAADRRLVGIGAQKLTGNPLFELLGGFWRKLAKTDSQDAIAFPRHFSPARDLSDGARQSEC